MRGCSLAMALWAGVLAACASETLEIGPPARLEAGFTRVLLRNGLEVLVLPDHSSPLLTAMLTVRAGAFVEDETQSGYSHLLEHMLFKSNQLEPDPEALQLALQRRGILHNAVTARDLVAYYYVMPTDQREESMELFAASLRAPQFDQASLQTEIDVVLAEHDRVESYPSNLLRRRVSELLFQQYSNRVDPLGGRAVIEKSTAERIQELYQRYYVPNNAYLILIGDIDADAGIALAKQHFGSWEKAPDPFLERPIPLHPALRKSRFDLLTARVESSRLIVAFQAPSTTRDFRSSVAADLLAHATLQKEHVFRTLVEPPVIVAAGLWHEPSPRKGTLAIELTIGAGQELAALAKLRRLGNFARGTTLAQIETARDELWSERAFASEQTLELTFQLASDWALGRTAPEHDVLATLYELGPADLERCWQQYFADQPAVAVLLTNPVHASAEVREALERVW